MKKYTIYFNKSIIELTEINCMQSWQNNKLEMIY